MIFATAVADAWMVKKENGRPWPTDSCVAEAEVAELYAFFLQGYRLLSQQAADSRLPCLLADWDTRSHASHMMRGTPIGCCSPSPCRPHARSYRRQFPPVFSTSSSSSCASASNCGPSCQLARSNRRRHVVRFVLSQVPPCCPPCLPPCPHATTRAPPTFAVNSSQELLQSKRMPNPRNGFV